MRMFFLFVFLCGAILGQEPSFVKEFHSTTDKESELIFIEKYKSSDNINVKGYLISLEMKQAEYAFFPWKKLSIFNRGKKQLSSLIMQYPNNIHLRYVRLVIQEHVPKILGYNKQIEEDKKVLEVFLNKKDKTDYLDTYILENTSL